MSLENIGIFKKLTDINNFLNISEKSLYIWPYKQIPVCLKKIIKSVTTQEKILTICNKGLEGSLSGAQLGNAKFSNLLLIGNYSL